MDRIPTLVRGLPTYAGMADEELVRRARHDPEAFAELFRRHAGAVNRYHLFKTGNADDAQDLTSQTFLAALEGLGHYRGQGSFCGWLFGIARHKVLDHYRRRRPQLSLDSAEFCPDPQPLLEDLVGTTLQMDQVVQALQSLPPDQSEALTLRVFAGLSAAETGRIMGKSEAAVKMLVYRGLTRLREHLTLEVSR